MNIDLERSKTGRDGKEGTKNDVFRPKLGGLGGGCLGVNHPPHDYYPMQSIYQYLYVLYAQDVRV